MMPKKRAHLASDTGAEAASLLLNRLLLHTRALRLDLACREDDNQTHKIESAATIIKL